MRTHLKTRHCEEYDRVVKLMKLKHSDDSERPVPDAPSSQASFDLEEWIRLLIRWIVSDDQVCFNAIRTH
jgi:hypothetical protein